MRNPENVIGEGWRWVLGVVAVVEAVIRGGRRSGVTFRSEVGKLSPSLSSLLTGSYWLCLGRWRLMLMDFYNWRWWW